MLPVYKNYKTSIAPFERQIPAHWEEDRLSWIFQFTSKMNNKNEELLSVFLDKGVVLYSSTSQTQVHKPSEDMSKYQLVNVGDFVLNNQQAWRGSVGVSKYRGIISPAYYVLKPRIDINSDYLNYMVRDKDVVNQFVLASKGVGSIQRQIYVPSLKTTVLAIPPRPEQDQIVRFLDWKTSEKARFIHEKKRQIRRLRELRASIINNAVTHGINPSVKLKDSGHAWIANIPEHWDMLYSKKLFALRKDKAFSSDEQLTSSQKYGVISQSEYMKIENRRLTVVMTGADILKHVEAGDFVISMRSFQGGIEYSKVSGKISSAYVMLIPNSELVYDRYFKWLLKSPSYIKALQGTSDLVRDGQALRYANFAKVYLPKVPLNEQEAIADYLDMMTFKIDDMIKAIRSEISYVVELRTKIIADVITGKVDVRNVEIPEYDLKVDDSSSEDDEETDEDSEYEDR